MGVLRMLGGSREEQGHGLSVVVRLLQALNFLNLLLGAEVHQVSPDLLAIRERFAESGERDHARVSLPLRSPHSDDQCL